MSTWGNSGVPSRGRSNSATVILCCWLAAWTRPARDEYTYSTRFWQAGTRVLRVMPGRRPQAATFCGVIELERCWLAGSWLLVWSAGIHGVEPYILQFQWYTKGGPSCLKPMHPLHWCFVMQLQAPAAGLAPLLLACLSEAAVAVLTYCRMRVGPQLLTHHTRFRRWIRGCRLRHLLIWPRCSTSQVTYSPYD